MERKRYAREFKLEAVRLVKERGVSARRHRGTLKCSACQRTARVGQSLCGGILSRPSRGGVR